MEETIDNEISPMPSSVPYSIWLISLVGAALGALYWGITTVIDRFIVNPIFCNASSESAHCLQSIGLSGDIATILVATIGIVVMVSLHMVRPLIIAVASGAVLWGLAAWTNGLAWGEVIVWNTLLYCLAYILFSWIARYSRIRSVIIAMLFIVIAIRIVVAL